MKTCKYDNNPHLAKGLCRQHYDAQPERIKKRSIYTKYLLSVGGKATRKRVSLGVPRKNNTEYLKAWRASNLDKFQEYEKKYYQLNKERISERRKINYHRKKRGEVYDNKTKTWRIPASNDSKVFKTITTNNKGTQSPPVSP